MLLYGNDGKGQSSIKFWTLCTVNLREWGNLVFNRFPSYKKTVSRITEIPKSFVLNMGVKCIYLNLLPDSNEFACNKTFEAQVTWIKIRCNHTPVISYGASISVCLTKRVTRHSVLNIFALSLFPFAIELLSLRLKRAKEVLNFFADQFLIIALVRRRRLYAAVILCLVDQAFASCTPYFRGVVEVFEQLLMGEQC